MADKLIVKGLGKQLDGEYEFSLSDILSIGEPESLTNREAHRIKVISGIRAGEIMEAVLVGDNDLLIALTVVILGRAGKRVNEESLWDAKVGSIDWDLEAVRNMKEVDEEDPPASPAETPETESASRSGGESSKMTSDQPASDQSPIGRPALVRSATFDQLTSVS